MLMTESLAGLAFSAAGGIPEARLEQRQKARGDVSYLASHGNIFGAVRKRSADRVAAFSIAM
jgi:hypothetical protein